MFNLATACLILWVPVVFVIFERMPVPKAIVVSFVTAWLFLPPTAIPLPGFPDWSKAVATVATVLVCTGMKRLDAYLRIKPRWFDLPVLAYCLCPFLSAVTSNEGAYDGASAVLEEAFRWGLPYLIGRAFLGDLRGNRLLCSAIALGGIAYIPICLFEIRMGPVLKLRIFGFNANNTVWGLRYGGYRPVGFLVTGLELGWWMCCASLTGYMLWRSGWLKRLYGYPMGPLLGFLALVTVACKSTGAILQAVVGLIVIHVARATKSSLILWSILLIPPAYCIVRTNGIWTGEGLVAYVDQYLGADRAQSLAYRFTQEDPLIRSAVQRPIFGWARNGGFNPPDKSGKILVTDGLWIIVLGTMGSVGLAALNAMLILPAAIFARKVRPQWWFDPEVAPVTALAVLLPLFMVDNLSNAMLNPIYAIAMGSVSGYLVNFSPAMLGRPQGRGLAAPRGPSDGPDHDPGESDPAVAAFNAERYSEAIRRLDDRLDDLHRAFRRRPTPELLIELGQAHAFRARCYSRMGEIERSIEEREYLLGLSTQYAALLDRDPVAYPEFAANLNDLAWSLLAVRGWDRDSVTRAATYAGRVVEAHPNFGGYWNTLGVAHYRSGDDLRAIQALSRSINLSDGQGSPYDFYYLALANHRLGYRKPAEAWLARGEAAFFGGGSDPAVAALRNEARSEMAA